MYGVRVIPVSQEYRENYDRIFKHAGEPRVDLKRLNAEIGKIFDKDADPRAAKRFVPDKEYCARVLPGLYGWVTD
jgi:hypothetical protein